MKATSNVSHLVLCSRGRAVTSGVSSNFSTRSTMDGHFFATVSGCLKKAGTLPLLAPTDRDGTTGVSHRWLVGHQRTCRRNSNLARHRQSRTDKVVPIGPLAREMSLWSHGLNCQNGSN